MINRFIDSVLIIDDKISEVKGLIKTFKKLDIWTTYCKPPKENAEIKELSQLRNRKLIFLDLRLDESQNTKDNIQTVIRPLFKQIIGKEFGSYGIVMWTNNPDHIDEFKEKIAKDGDKYDLPLFIVGLNKMRYIRNGYEELLEDLQRELEGSTAANFFIKWESLVKDGKNNTIQSVFSLINGYDEKSNKNLEYLLFNMAKNQIGLPNDYIDDYPLYIETFNAFANLLSYEIYTKSIGLSCDLFSKISNLAYFPRNIDLSKSYDSEYVDKDGNKIQKNITKKIESKKAFCKIAAKKPGCKAEIPLVKKEIDKLNNILKSIKDIDMEILNLFASLNKIILIDEAPASKLILPGNIYEIKSDTHILKSEKSNPEDTTLIIELTPPCDFANKKGAEPKFIGGFITKYSEGRLKQLNSTAIYTELFPIKINDKLSLLAFDFRYVSIISEDEIKDESKYRLLYRAKDQLFADILQKFASYSARLGLSIIR